MSRKERINKIFRAVADPTRREVFHTLVVAGTALSLTQLSQEFDITRQGVTKHVKILQESGLVEVSKQGREQYCTANIGALQEIKDWVAFYDQFWDGRLKNLGKFLDQTGQS